MRDQYAGDVSDFLKLSFLRAVAVNDRRLGVAWYYAPGDDGGRDGRHLEYRKEPGWDQVDAEAYRHLSRLEERSVAALERLPIWPAHSVFHRTPLVSRNRAEWVQGMADAMNSADLVFLDPDNGLGNNPNKHADPDDVVALRRNGRALAFITFPQRGRRHEDQIKLIHDSLLKAAFSHPFTVSTVVHVPQEADPRLRRPLPRFFTVVNSDDELLSRAQSFAVRLAQHPHAGASVTVQE